MQVIVNTDSNIDDRDDTVTAAENDIRESLDRFASKLTRVEAHLHDESAGRHTGADKRCMLEARPAGLDPVAVSCLADSYAEAVSGATAKLHNLLTSRFAKLTDQTHRDTIRHVPRHS